MSDTSPSQPRASLLLIVLAYIGFVSLGLPDAVLGVAWPSLRDHFELKQSTIGLIFLFSGCGYFLSSFFSGRAVQYFSIGLLLAGSTLLVGLSAFGFALAPIWWALLAFGVLHGLGSGAIDAGLNGYAASHLSAGHMNRLHACYCLGAMLGPLVMTGAILFVQSYFVGYAVIGSVLLSLAVVFMFTRPLWGRADVKDDDQRVDTWTALRNSAVVLHMAVFFVYTGLEVAVGQWAFTVFTEHRGVAIGAAGLWVSAYWGSIAIGRVVFGSIVDRIGIDRLLRFGLVASVGGALLMALPVPVELAFVGLVVTALGLAPVFPCLMARTPQRLGAAVAAHAVGFQVATAMIGAAVVPAAIGIMADAWGLGVVGPTALGLACFLFVLHELLMRWGQQS